MKKMLALTLVLLMFCSTAFAYNPARFESVENVTVDYDPADPTSYVVKAGFGTWTQFGGHFVARYFDAGKAQELPMILAAFTTASIKATNMSVRTDAHLYTVRCSDLSQAGLSTIETEATLLVAPASQPMLKDIAQSGYAKVTIWGDDPAKSATFMVDDSARKLISLFLDEYEEELLPRLTEGSTLSRVYEALSPQVSAAEVPAMGPETAEIMNAEYTTLRNGSWGEDVRLLQQGLKDLGYLNDKADGIFGKRTAAGVRAFQESIGLSANGIADAATQIELYMQLWEKGL